MDHAPVRLVGGAEVPTIGSGREDLDVVSWRKF
jgi:hypothetical protein